MAITISNYGTLTPAIGTLTNSEAAFRPDKGLASTGFFFGDFDILPQLNLPGNAIAPLTGLEVLIDSASTANSDTANGILVSFYNSASVSYSDKAHYINGWLPLTTTPQNYIIGSSSIKDNVWQDGSNKPLYTGSAFIQTLSSASSATNKARITFVINTGANIVSFSNIRVKLTYTPATSPSTDYTRPDEVKENTTPLGGVGFLTPENLLDVGGEAGSGYATSDESGSIIVVGYPNLSIPAGATVTGYEFQGEAVNLGSGSIPTYGNIDLDVQIGTGSTFGDVNSFRLASGDTDTPKNLAFGGDGDLQGLDLTATEANDLVVKFTYKNASVQTSSLALVGDAESTFPALRVYYDYTPASSYTRAELRNKISASEDFNGTDAVTFTLVNNLTTTAYFNIEGARISPNNYKDIFNSASVTDLVNCSVITESAHAGFIVNPDVTASFTFAPTTGGGINKEDIRFVASNPKLISGSTQTVYGIELGLT